jgi:hypothetical protein
VGCPPEGSTHRLSTKSGMKNICGQTLFPPLFLANIQSYSLISARECYGWVQEEGLLSGFHMYVKHINAFTTINRFPGFFSMIKGLLHRNWANSGLIQDVGGLAICAQCPPLHYDFGIMEHTSIIMDIVERPDPKGPLLVSAPSSCCTGVPNSWS